MIKAHALRLVSSDEVTANDTSELTCLIGNNQNMIIESFMPNEHIPTAISGLAIRMLKHDAIIRDIINELRISYVSKKSDFHISLVGKSKAEKDIIISLLQDMYGVISVLHYIPETEMIIGKMIFSFKAQMFMTGQYLEIAVYEYTRQIVEEIARKHNKTFEMYRNVRVATKEGLLKNEFDIVIEFNGTIYVLEIKSGKNFREFDKYMYIGQEYKIVPNRFLLVDNYLTDANAETVEYFCDYYVSNLSGDSLKNKIVTMIENDI